jgi:hypothetical protein
MEINVKNMSNTDLAKIQKELTIEFDSVKIDLIKLYDYWVSIEKRYHEVNNELNDRFGVNNK